MKKVQELVKEIAGGDDSFRSFGSVYRVHRPSRVRYWFWGILASIGVILFLPWTQHIKAKGTVTTLRQEQRPQQLNSILAGRIVHWYVKEGDKVKKGDTLVQLAEIKDDYLDPDLLLRTSEQLNAKMKAQEGYRGKLLSYESQWKALENARDLKQSDWKNKLLQQQDKIISDSMEWVAAKRDFDFKTLQLQRQQTMYDSGLVSLLQLEQRTQSRQESGAKLASAEIKFNNARREWQRLQWEMQTDMQQYREKLAKVESERYQTLSSIASADAEIAKLQNQYNNYRIRSGQYFITAPQDGQVLQANKAGINEIIKEGEPILEIAPDEYQYAVELYIKPVDMPLLNPGQKIRFVFDGFPAIVFSGWPDASFGTFGGKVIAIENAMSSNGLFRVMVVEDTADRPWPRQLRLGAGAAAIALLNDVPVWYELWRNINGFPPDYYAAPADKGKTK